MLSPEEKREMLEDAQNKRRREDFRAAKPGISAMSFDEYILFLDAVQKIFSPFKQSRQPTRTQLNKL